jgi:hypothetical protein
MRVVRNGVGARAANAMASRSVVNGQVAVAAAVKVNE